MNDRPVRGKVHKQLWKLKQRHAMELLRKFNDAWSRGEIVKVSDSRGNK